ncbi:MAG: glycosyltransferase family 2 protein [Bacteroidia bacterium]|nr:glycosyltransferase family 2 protein [Bacteroidia bacterium]
MLVSVIIPCRNEVKYIEECINAIYNSSNIDFETIEVLIIDGKSNDGTLQIIKQLQQKYPTLKLIENTLQLTPYAFNLGINNSVGKYVQIIGVRQIVKPNYISNAIHTLTNNSEIWCVGGKVINVFENNDSETIAAAMSSWFGVGGGNFRILTQSAFVDTVGTPMYPRAVFDKIGLFDQDLVRNQDDDYNYRVTYAGGKIFLNVDIAVKYYVRASFQNLFKQYYQYGYWKVFVNKKHNTLTTLRQLVPALFVLYLLSLIVIAGVLPNIYFGVYFVGMLIYILSALYAASKVSTISTNYFKIVGTFFILHLSYGFGYLEGLMQFVILKRAPKNSSKTLSR